MLEVGFYAGYLYVWPPNLKSNNNIYAGPDGDSCGEMNLRVLISENGATWSGMDVI